MVSGVVKMNLLMSKLQLYAEWLTADEAWHNELVRMYKGNAREYRFDTRYNQATPLLRELRQKFINAGNAYRGYCNDTH